MHVNQRPARLRGLCHALVLGGLVAWTGAQAGMTTDRNGNVGYDTAAECDAAMQVGTVRAYQPFTEHPPLRREGEADVKRMTLRELASAEALASQLGFNAADYARGACDRGVGRSQGRDGVSGDARTEQRAILCETNATPAKIQQIQRALRQAGFDPGPIDGVIREQTMTAVHRYQQAKRLPVDGYLNLETVKALGVSPL